jgi:dipeptidyl aminopeptidase/acylaminoacyl peptidase
MKKHQRAMTHTMRPSVEAACLAILICLFSTPALLAQGAKVEQAAKVEKIDKANYELAARWTSQKVGKLVFDTSVTPHWFELSDRFWYSYETREGKKYYVVDPVRRARTPMFDNAKMAVMLTNLTRLPYDAQHLPIKNPKLVKKDTVLLFEVEVPKDADIPGVAKEEKKEEKVVEQEKGVKAQAAEKPPEEKTRTLYFEYELATGKLTLLDKFESPKKPRWASVSPDDKWVVFARGHNLFMMDAANYALALKKADDPKIVETPITTDGVDRFSYARRLTDEDRKELKLDEKAIEKEKSKGGPRVPSIMIHWSKDSKKFAVVRPDERKVGDLWVINSLSNPRPTLETYPYPMPGEANVRQAHLEVFDRETKARVEVKADRFKDQTVAIADARQAARARDLEKMEPQWVSETSDKLYFTRTSRDLHRVDVCLADPQTGDVKTLIEERLNTYIETKPLRLVGNGKELIYWSERDGWGHYYLYDDQGKLKNQITSGEFVSDAIEGVDEVARVLYFTAMGREANEDPYFQHLYRVKLDGTGLTLLNPGDASHATTMTDSTKYVVDNFSRVNTAPKGVLRDALGAQLVELETTDVSALTDAGYTFPEPFKVKADDGITDLYGVMYKPFDFDPNKKYPIIAYVYPGPQTESVTKTFSPKSANVPLAQFGFIVIEVGNRGGNPQRSKWYHNYGYGNLRDYGLADKKAAIEQLARKHPFIDIDRVGITGHSGGGFMSTAAMLVFPDFFKVAVSESGNHENNIYNNSWSEKHHGVKEVTDKDGTVKFEYSIEKNSELAKNLKGHLMLTTGDIDDNVHMANTLRMANALIKANKRFDFFILPGLRHSYADVADYFFWVRSDYFCRYLIGDTSAQSVDMIELNREKEQTGEKKR